ncbi:hypothetical protein DBV15_04641 [Temnothorax longispinosus]|uniref:Uncharacterized protein n=1 Tax=Temnothorax longispinosus TaxID=300112 RepID=A0A4S2JMV8_9HYME|nr:hypothetical protein DBV15_04641 [Temnothorax longispinosus]
MVFFLELYYSKINFYYEMEYFVVNDLTGSFRGPDDSLMSSIERDLRRKSIGRLSAHASRVATVDPRRSPVKITIEDKC